MRKHLILPKIQNMTDIKVKLLQWSLNFLIKKTSGERVKNEDISNKELGRIKKQKLIAKRNNQRKVHSPDIDNIWGTDLADMQLLSKFNRGFRFLLYVFYIYRKYACVISLKDKQWITITNPFQKVLDESKCKRNKIWVDEGCDKNKTMTRKT